MKLFKTLRQDFIKQGNVKRYLLYAVGEILLVMIGISLAFQVSNWDDNRIKKNAEIRYYENIRDQIVDDKALIIRQVHFNNRYLTQFKYANEILETNDRNKIDTLGLIIRNITQYSDFDREGNIYETMANSGEIKLLRNYKIVNSIRELEEKYMYVNRMENIHYDVIMDHIAPAVYPNIKMSTGQIQKPDLIYRYEFQNLLFGLLQVMTEKDKVYHEALAEIEVTTALIAEELDNK